MKAELLELNDQICRKSDVISLIIKLNGIMICLISTQLSPNPNVNIANKFF